MPSKKQTFLRRMNTKAQDLLMADEDLRLVVNAEYDSKLGAVRKVRGYSQVGDQMTALDSITLTDDADWNAGTHSGTIANDGSLTLRGGSILQGAYNNFNAIYGNNYIAQSFRAEATTLNKLAVYLDKVTGSSLLDYDTFNSSIDATKWATSGLVTETATTIRVYARSGSTLYNSDLNTDGKTNGDPILGYSVTVDSVSSQGGGLTSSATGKILFTNATDKIWWQWERGGGGWRLHSAGSYGTNDNIAFTSGVTLTAELKKVDSDFVMYVSGVEIYRWLNISPASNSYFDINMLQPSAGSSEEYLELSNNPKFYENVTPLSDMTVTIQTDSASAPSGSTVSGGTSTIAQSSVDTTTNLIEATFSSLSLTLGSTYWMILSQTGGDSSNYYRVYKSNKDVYQYGTVMTSSNAGSTYIADTDGLTDLGFRLDFSFATSGTWISASQTLATGQTMSQLILAMQDMVVSNQITQIDITNVSNVSQSAYTTPITTGSSLTLRSSDFSSGFTYTNGNTFRIKLTLVGSGDSSPAVKSISLDSPERKILELSPLYQATSGNKSLMAVISGTIKQLVSGSWIDVKTNLTTGLDAGSTIFRASKQAIQSSGTASSGDLSSLTTIGDTTSAVNQWQGYFIKITGGTGIGQIRLIQSNTGTSSSTSTTTSTSSTTTTSSSTTTTTTTSTSSSTTVT